MSAARPKNPSGPKNQAATSARARLAAERAQQERRRRQLLIVAIPVAVVLVAVVALVVVRLVGRSTPTPTTANDPAVITAVTSVPTSTLDEVGVGTANNAPRAIDAPALTADGKPRVLYVGAEYCPYCAAERWATVVALSRFGTFSDLGQTTSSADDVYPSTPTLSFHGSTFSSDSISFTGVELQGNTKVNGRYPPLDILTAADQQVFDTYNAPPYVDAGARGSIPFVDIGGRYLSSGATFTPDVLQGKTHAEIAAALADPDSPVAQGVDGAANLITAAICASTDQAPSEVCTSPGVTAAAAQLS